MAITHSAVHGTEVKIITKEGHLLRDIMINKSTTTSFNTPGHINKTGVLTINHS